MNQYTKGEWKAEIGYRDCFIVSKSDEGITGIATIHKRDPLRGSVEANAQLISAAPAMYEALNKVRLLLNLLSGQDLVEISAKGTSIKLIDKALARAEGKQ